MLGSAAKNFVLAGQTSAGLFKPSLSACRRGTRFGGLQKSELSGVENGCNSLVKSRRGIQGIGSSRTQEVARAVRIPIRSSSSSMAVPTKQTAWLYNEYGPKENLFLTEIDIGELAPDEVLVKAKALSLNPIDFKRRQGYLKAMEPPPPSVPGFDVAGEVVKVGSNVTSFKVGDKVYGDASESVASGNGTFAHYTKAKEKLLDIIPEPLSFAEAASLPLALQTAYQSLEKANLKEGQSVIILGGAGGVGTLGLQLAKHVFKASVIATTGSAHKIDLLKSLGATVVIDYKSEPLSEHPTKYDVVFDAVGKGEGLKVLKEGGFAVTIAGQPQPPEVRHVMISKGSDLKKLGPLFANGTLKPVIDKVFKFSDVVKAFEYLESGRATGKVVISPID